MFKLFYKIINANKSTILTFSIIFIAIFSLFVLFSDSMSGGSAVYEQEKLSIAIVDKDHSELSRELVKRLESENNAEVKFKSDNDRKDALFFGQLNAIITIPNTFEEDFETEQVQHVQMQLRPDDASGVVIKQKLNSFLASVKSYRSVDASLSYSQAAALATKDLDKKAEITFLKSKGVREEDMMRNLYYNFLSYVLFSVIVMTLGAAMHTIYQSEMLKRILISPINSSKMNMRLVFANISFGVVLWGLFTAIILITHGENMFNSTGLLSIINSFIFALLCICFAFMAMSFVSNKKHARNKLDTMTNIFGLCGSFFGGAFLPQRFMPDNILVISKFMPNYWYVKLNDNLSTLTDVTSDALSFALQSFGIQLLFAIAFLAIGLVVMKSKRSQDTIINSDYE